MEKSPDGSKRQLWCRVASSYKIRASISEPPNASSTAHFGVNALWLMDFTKSVGGRDTIHAVFFPDVSNHASALPSLDSLQQ